MTRLITIWAALKTTVDDWVMPPSMKLPALCAKSRMLDSLGSPMPASCKRLVSYSSSHFSSCSMAAGTRPIKVSATTAISGMMTTRNSVIIDSTSRTLAVRQIPRFIRRISGLRHKKTKCRSKKRIGRLISSAIMRPTIKAIMIPIRFKSRL
ncbi:hypothetical protein SDC9_120927 [bioreactor metagenome]|uniref:Uncharacterized protein n=1 Tax=bioreactor metagenome TaxID=1076179 RepID=A0A645CAL3_9ZZZZ